MCPFGTVTSPCFPPRGPITVHSPERGALEPGGKSLIVLILLPPEISPLACSSALGLNQGLWWQPLIGCGVREHSGRLLLLTLEDGPDFQPIVMSIVRFTVTPVLEVTAIQHFWLMRHGASF